MFSQGGHEYTFDESGVRYKNPAGHETHLSFSEKLNLRHSSWSGELSLRGRGGRIPIGPIPPGEQLAFLSAFFGRWKSRSPEAAKKSAFDYIDGQKGFVALAFTASLLFALPVAVGLLADSRDQFQCTTVLERGSVVGAMNVVKFKRKRKGHYILDLEFTAPDGTKITGRDQLITFDETKIPKTVPVVYSPERPSCWSLTPNLSGTEVNWAKRRYFGYFTGMFGAFFLFSALFGISWSLSRWLRPRPFRAEIAQIFSL